MWVIQYSVHLYYFMEKNHQNSTQVDWSEQAETKQFKTSPWSVTPIKQESRI